MKFVISSGALLRSLHRWSAHAMVFLVFVHMAKVFYRAALLIALMQTPHRFRTKRQLWAYCGLALRTCDSGEYRYVGGQLKRSKKAVTIRGLNKNYNHDLKNILRELPPKRLPQLGLSRISTRLVSPTA